MGQKSKHSWATTSAQGLIRQHCQVDWLPSGSPSKLMWLVAGFSAFQLWSWGVHVLAIYGLGATLGSKRALRVPLTTWQPISSKPARQNTHLISHSTLLKCGMYSYVCVRSKWVTGLLTLKRQDHIRVWLTEGHLMEHFPNYAHYISFKVKLKS